VEQREYFFGASDSLLYCNRFWIEKESPRCGLSVSMHLENESVIAGGV